MNNLDQAAEKYEKQFPHYKTYAQCQSKAFMVGTFTLASATAGTYVLQEMLRTRLPYPRLWFFFTSFGVGSVVAYRVTKMRTKNCQEMWMAMEDKHSALSETTETMLNSDSDLKQ